MSHRMIAVSLLAVAALAAAMIPPVHAQVITPEGKTKLLLDFEDAKIWSSENDSPFAVSDKQVSQGKGSLKVTFTNKPTWSNIWTSKAAGDWSAFKYLNFDIFLEGDEPVDFGMWVRDAGTHKAEASWQIGPGWNTVTLDFAEMKKAFGLDLATIKDLCIYKDCKQEITVHLDNMYLSEQKPVPPKAEPVKLDGKELVVNGGFEEMQPLPPATMPIDGVASLFKGWTAKRWEGASFMGAAKLSIYEGKGALLLDGRGPCKIGVYSGSMKIQSPTRLTLSARIQGSDLTKGLYGQVGSILVTDFADRGIANAAITVPAGTYAWSDARVTFDVPAKTPVVKVFIQLYGRGLLWVDNVSLKGVELDSKLGQVVNVAKKDKLENVDGPIVTESVELLVRKADALQALKDLAETVKAAKAKGVETLYDEIPLELAKLAFNVRWDLPDHLALREGYVTYLEQRAKEAKAHLQSAMDGKSPDLKVPPHPDFSKLKLEGPYFVQDGKPQLLLSMQYISSGELTRWFTPINHSVYVPAVGASRYDFQQSPIWEVYQKDPDSRRVYDNGWCGHIIRDAYSAGGSERCVISLESPAMREAIAKCIASKAEAAKAGARFKDNIFLNMGFEYAYRNYDAASLKLFREYLAKNYGEIAKLNDVWKTKFASFDDVTLPSYEPGKVEPNPGKYYDWGQFNLWRFTDFMKWARGEIRKHIDLPAVTGGGNPFGAGFWSDGLDEEYLMAEGAIDFWLSETGSRALGITSLMDLQRSLAPGKMILDPEYHALPNTCMLMFLHGCGIMHYWWWPDDAGEFYESSMKHSATRSLAEVETVMRDALDLRRLGSEVAAFRAAPTQIALLYSRASLVQAFPGAAGAKTPYSMESEKTYSAASRLDASVGFISTRQVLAGDLSKLKVLVIPAARFVAEDEFAKITDFVKSGGTLLITPTSLVADQYNRRRNYLQQLGLEITAEELPEMIAGKAVRGVDQPPGEMDFIQGPVAKTVVTKEPKKALTTTDAGAKLGLDKTLSGEGILQTVRASEDWTALAAYEGGSPALLSRTLGKGNILYQGAQLAHADQRGLLEAVMQREKFTRPIRVTDDKGRRLDDVESRTVEAKDGLLTYLANLSGEKRTVKLTAAGAMGEILNLSAAAPEPSATMTLAPYETRILKITIGK